MCQILRCKRMAAYTALQPKTRKKSKWQFRQFVKLGFQGLDDHLDGADSRNNHTLCVRR